MARTPGTEKTWCILTRQRRKTVYAWIHAAASRLYTSTYLEY
ncbi:hypothetical protein HMPREF1324_0972 [Rothia aeria F0474]|uniref:Uncharacterized protein n=1 Tax=Rothia aeria F0474 TaxID=1125724 RepID=I0UVL7_9MICC|nr:hypothetical protein HMPREF1324_0972 [Rothia aeria F0474]